LFTLFTMRVHIKRGLDVVDAEVFRPAAMEIDDGIVRTVGIRFDHGRNEFGLTNDM
jgi:hypothetical protein